MTDQTPNSTNEQQEPFIPPRYLLILSALGFIVALIVGLTQPSFTVIGYGGLAFGILALLLWALLSPDSARSAITGRTVRFGGTSLLVTLLMLVVLIGIYAVVRNENWRVDLTQTNSFSLSPESSQAVAGLAADPAAPKVQIIAFYGPSQAGQRDQDTLLFDDYVKTSNGKISYEFVDPEQQPQTASLYKVTSAGSIAVAKVGDDGQPDTQNAQVITSADQGNLTNAILKVSASGVFDAYVLDVADGAGGQMTTIKNILTTRYGWKVTDIAPTDLTNPNSTTFIPNDPNATAQVIVIPGGSSPLTSDALTVIENFVSKGGSLIIFAGNVLNSDKTSLATDDALNTWLMQNFGMQFNKDVVLDAQAYQTVLNPVATDLDGVSFITTNGIPRGQAAVIFTQPDSITIAGSLPANVTATSLVRSTTASYSKTDLQAVLDNHVDQADGDATGPFVLAASAENSQTHARVVLLGSTSLGTDDFASPNIDNVTVAFNSLIWATNFNDYFTQITVQQQQRPQDQPIFADQQTIRNINFITIVLLPFGVLGLGILVWWNNRERAR